MDAFTSRLQRLLNYLDHQGRECEWVEYKVNDSNPNQIGKYISAMANAACVEGRDHAYLVFGVEDSTRSVVGTIVRLREQQVGKDDLEHFLITQLEPKIMFSLISGEVDGKHVEVLKIPAAVDQPIRFKKKSYIRVNSVNRELNTLPEKQRIIWLNGIRKSYERRGLITVPTVADVINLLDVQTYFDLLNLPFPTTQDAISEQLIDAQLIRPVDGQYEISICAGLLLAKDLEKFEEIKRKSVRLIMYSGKDRTGSLKQFSGTKGYAVGFEGLVKFIVAQLPGNEVIKTALRNHVTIYPDIAIREFVGNTIVHQDLMAPGGPLIEIFSDRIEFTNTGEPLIKTDRFIDEYRSRNEMMADFLRRMGVCEELGSGVDKAIMAVEAYQLRAPVFEVREVHTKVTLFASQGYSGMNKEDRIRACYQHCCLRHVTGQAMTNPSLRERFKLRHDQSATVSRIIRDTIEKDLIKSSNPESESRKYASYIPYWA